MRGLTSPCPARVPCLWFPLSMRTWRGGLGNAFLGHVRNADALCVIVRTFPDERVSHVNGSVDAARDVESLDTELILADLASVERRLEKTSRQAKSGDPKYREELAILNR